MLIPMVVGGAGKTFRGPQREPERRSQSSASWPLPLASSHFTIPGPAEVSRPHLAGSKARPQQGYSFISTSVHPIPVGAWNLSGCYGSWLLGTWGCPGNLCGLGPDRPSQCQVGPASVSLSACPGPLVSPGMAPSPVHFPGPWTLAL